MIPAYAHPRKEDILGVEGACAGVKIHSCTPGHLLGTFLGAVLGPHGPILVGRAHQDAPVAFDFQAEGVVRVELSNLSVPVIEIDS